MSDYPVNSTAAVYHDQDGKPCTLLHLIKTEPEWTRNRFVRMLGEIKDLKAQLQSAKDEIEDLGYQIMEARE